MTKHKNSDTVLRRSAARLAAIQATYQIILTSAPVDAVINDFMTGAIGGEVIEEDLDLETEDVVPLIELNAEIFAVLVRGVHASAARLDAIIDGSLGSSWDPARLQPLLRAVLRCGVYELSERPDMPARACISEYVDIARSFFDGSEPGMVNAMMDKLARQLRPEEMNAVHKPRSDGNNDGTV
ncbi:transcription antitermination factor NusB [Haematospirillum sp. H1815]|uniref:transcription antitermination factor NusB n=1 Tax=Haematospirillum sp. H1815 TaxID=2723108 RepID=UPI00143A27A9|nr:transcription antitermination factor NusB [Haematospirillum sp. H1815]NKD76410.1 transcription antitermination factor NusB [Haematospirillum sp. H1815]